MCPELMARAIAYLPCSSGMTSCLHQYLNILTFQECGAHHKLELKAAIFGDDCLAH
jgi:hypothetical protein